VLPAAHHFAAIPYSPTLSPFKESTMHLHRLFARTTLGVALAAGTLAGATARFPASR
jgi:hypothetical protein